VHDEHRLRGLPGDHHRPVAEVADRLRRQVVRPGEEEPVFLPLQELLSLLRSRTATTMSCALSSFLE